MSKTAVDNLEVVQEGIDPIKDDLADVIRALRSAEDCTTPAGFTAYIRAAQSGLRKALKDLEDL